MGQYYKGVIVGKNKKTLITFLDTNGYAKLTEHSWLKNPFVNSFESLIFKNPQRVVWAGDYAEECKGYKTNLYDRCKDEKQATDVREMKPSETRFIINHSKKLFVDKTKLSKDSDGWKLHPLPILTCEGNGQGGGDYYGEDTFNLVGSWARDLISVDNEKPVGFTELKFLLKPY